MKPDEAIERIAEIIGPSREADTGGTPDEYHHRAIVNEVNAVIEQARVEMIDHEENILEEANRIVGISEGRTLRYGHPAINFTHTANMWRAAFAWDVNAQKVAMAIILLKLSREVNMHTRDNLTDIAGYARTIEMVEDYFEEARVVEEIRKKVSESGDNPPPTYTRGMCQSCFDVDGDTVHCTGLLLHDGNHRGTHVSGAGVQWRDADGYVTVHGQAHGVVE